MKKLAVFILSIVFLVAQGCKPKSARSNQTETPIPKIEVTDTPAQDDDDTIQEYGLVTNVEDGAYPMFIVTVEFPEREISQDFNLNAQANEGLAMLDLGSLIGNYATIHYTSELENFLLDIHHQGNSLLGEYAPEFDSNWKSITGTLGEASEETMGDLPDQISVTDQNGKSMWFAQYITSEMVEVNGMEVTVYYEIRGNNTITKITPSE